MNPTPAFSLRGRTFVRSTASEVRSALIVETGIPSSRTISCFALEKQTIETRTAAPSTIHGSSLHASKITVSSLMRCSKSRLAPPRIELVATNPTRSHFLATNLVRAFSNQYITRSAPPRTLELKTRRSSVTYSSPSSRDHQFVAQKRRIADDELGLRPLGFDVAHLLPRPACGERVGVRGPLRRA